MKGHKESPAAITFVFFDQLLEVPDGVNLANDFFEHRMEAFPVDVTIFSILNFPKSSPIRKF